MSEDTDFAVVTKVPKLDDLSLSQILSLDRSVLANVIERMGLIRQAPETAVSAFTNHVSVRPT